MDRDEYFYYNQKWQLLEIDNADNEAVQQFVWNAWNPIATIKYYAVDPTTVLTPWGTISA